MYPTQMDGKSVAVERFIGTLKNKIYKYMASISKNVYIDKLRDVVEKCNNTYHRTIRTKPTHVESKTYTNISKNIFIKKFFKVGDYVRILKHKNYFCKRLRSELVSQSFCYQIS